MSINRWISDKHQQLDHTLQVLKEIFAIRETPAKEPVVPTNKPDAFNGQARTARQFLREVNLQFNTNPHLFVVPGRPQDDKLKVAYVLSLCTGSDRAHNFAELQYNTMKKEGFWPTWAKFEKEFQH